VSTLDLASTASVASYSGATGNLSTCLKFIANGQLVFQSSSSKINIRDVLNNLNVLTLSATVIALEQLATGLLASTGWENTLNIWSETSGALLHTFYLNAPHYFLKQTSNPSYLASCDNNGTIYVWQVKYGYGSYKNFSGISQTGCYMESPGSKSSSQLLTASWDGYLQLWNYAQSTCLQVFNPFYDVLKGLHLITSTTFMTFGNPSYVLLMAIDSNLKFKVTGRVVTSGPVNDMALMSDLNSLLIAVQGRLEWYTISTGRMTKSLNLSTSSINYLAYSGKHYSISNVKSQISLHAIISETYYNCVQL
jgi:WD40 repeat protein